MKKKKIALVGFHLHGGGTARVMANLSNFFNEKNIEVHNIIIHDEIGYDYSGKLYNLGKLKSRSNTIFNKIKRFIALRKYVKQEEFDFIIDFRFRKRILQEYLISRFVYNLKKTIYTIHSSQLEIYLPKSKFWTNVIYGKAYKVIAITIAMKEMIENKYDLNNVLTIYNSIDFDHINNKFEASKELKFEYIVGIGQYNNNIKQFDKLIEAYAKSKLPNKNIALVILGEGTLKEDLISVSKKFEVENLVHFLGFKNNPFKYIKHAKYFVLSSKFEGLSMAMLETLACCTPVVSFNCPTGPKEVISHGENGLLIENQNFEALTEGINTMMVDKTLYKKCKDNSLASVKKFSLEVIGKQWLNLMNFKN